MISLRYMMSSIASVSISGTLDQKLAAIADAGFTGVEIFENDLLGFDGSVRDVRRIIEDLGLVCTCYQPFRDFEGLPIGMRARALERAEAKFDCMDELGAKLLLVCSNVHREAIADRSRIVEDFRLLGDRAAARGLRVGYEALAWGLHVNDHRQAWEIVRETDHPAIGLVLDSFHSLSRRVPISSIAQIAPEKIFLMQIADAPDLRMDHLYWSRHFRCFPFQGDLAVADFVAAAARIGYDGPLSLEIFNDRFREWSARRLALDGFRSLKLLRDQAGIGEELPPRVQIQGIDFIEFAAQADEARSLASLFGRLGFTHVGEHRSKDVSLWSQAEVHLIINRDASGWANAHWRNHGTSVCAIALRVTSAAAALARAAALSFDACRQRVAAGELEIPWIRGVGDALTYFTEPDRGHGHWTEDFLPSGAGSAAAGGARDRMRRPASVIRRIDHLSQTMRVQEFLSWQLYYIALFDLQKAPPVEVSDTLGLVQSQELHSRGGSFRVNLYGTSANQTLAARFVEGEMGAGVQHIAFQTDDIRAAAGLAAANGLAVLPVPPNYYDDLRARFGLSAESTAQLAERNLFYDRDDGGEYFQLYTRAFEKRFFFELVERRGYAGYGVGNEGIRLAAQARYKPARID